MRPTRSRTPVTSGERLAREFRAYDLAHGVVRIPLTCPACEGRKLDGFSFPREVWCLGCGRETTERKVHTHHRQSIRHYIIAGEVRHRVN